MMQQPGQPMMQQPMMQPAGPANFCAYRVKQNRAILRLQAAEKKTHALALVLASTDGAQAPALQQWFAAVDDDRSGRVSTDELQRALAMGGLNFSLKLAASLLRMHDTTNSNSSNTYSTLIDTSRLCDGGIASGT